MGAGGGNEWGNLGLVVGGWGPTSIASRGSLRPSAGLTGLFILLFLFNPQTLP